MKKYILFYNPASGHAVFKKKLDWMISSFQKRGLLLIPYRTQKAGNEAFCDVVREIHPEGLVVAGGDGTVNEIINLMMHYRIDLPLAIIGCGTSNDFATYLKINRDMNAYFDRIEAGETRFIDLGCVGDTCFINVASAGMLSSVAHEVDVRLKNALGKIAYYIKGLGELPKIRAFPLQIVSDGESFQAEVFLFVVANSSVVGSMKNIGTDIEVDDGKLDLLAIRKCSIPKLMTILADLLAGKPISEKEYVYHTQAKEFTLSSTESLQSDLDGEEGPQLPLHIKTIHHALRVYA